MTQFTDAAAYYVPLQQVIQRQLLLDPSFSKELKDWGELRRGEDGALEDIQDGEVTRLHPVLGRPRADGAPIRLAFGTYADDVEVVNPIGSARVKHKLTLHYATILNLPSHVRMRLDKIFLMSVVLTKDQSAVGVHKVLQGASHSDAAAHSQMTFAETMRMFARDEGITFTVPKWESSGFYAQAYQAFLVLVSADTLAAAELIGFKRGFNPSVFKPCWQCHVHGMYSQ